MALANKVAAADALDIGKILASAVKEAEKATALAPVFMQRTSFASKAISTGSLYLDYIMGGGVPCGRIVGVSGPEHSGKSLIMTDMAVQALAAGSRVVYMDAEGGNDPIFLLARGIDFEKFRGKRDKAGLLKKDEEDLLFYYQPETGDQLVNYMHGIMSALPDNRNASIPPIVFFLDSAIALITDAISEDIDSNKMAMHAKMYSEILPIINHQLVRTGCSFVYSNQLRQKPMVQFGSPDYEPCGSALQFFSSIRLRLSSAKPKLSGDRDHPFLTENVTGVKFRQGGVAEEPHLKLDDSGVDEEGKDKKASKPKIISTGGLDKYIYTAVRTIKNKVYNPQKAAWMRISFERDGATGNGLDPTFDLFTFAMESGLIEKPGAKWEFTYTDKGKLLVPTLGLGEHFTYPELKCSLETDYRPKITAVREACIASNLVYGD